MKEELATQKPSYRRYIIIASQTFAVLNFILNLYYLPVTILNLKSKGGPEGWGLLLLPFSLGVNALVFTGAMAFTQKYKKSILLLLLNFIGFVLAFMLLLILLTTPYID